MNTIDTAKAWVKLYEFKTGDKYSPGEHKEFIGQGKGVKGTFFIIAKEVGVEKNTAWEYLQLLENLNTLLKTCLKEDQRV